MRAVRALLIILFSASLAWGEPGIRPGEVPCGTLLTQIRQGVRLTLDYDAWAKLAQSGDREAREVLAAHLSVILGPYYSRHRVPESDVDDMVQSALYDIFTNLNQWDSKRQFSNWMYTVARHCLARTRRDANTLSRGGGVRRTSNEAVLRAIPQRAEEAAELAEQLDLMSQALQKLPSEYRDALLQFMKTPSYQDSADALGWNIHTFRSRLGKARIELANRLKESLTGK